MANESDKNVELPLIDHFSRIEDSEDAVSSMPLNSTFINGDDDPKYACPEIGASRENQIRNRRIIKRLSTKGGRGICTEIFSSNQDKLRLDIELASTMDASDSVMYMRGVFERWLVEDVGSEAAIIMESVQVRRAENFEGVPYFVFTYDGSELF